jgi:antitoxin component of MazEF toxin-antitoxin module
MRTQRKTPAKRKTATLAKWGNSAAVRLSAEVVEAAQFAIGARLSVTVTNGSVILSPAPSEPIPFDLEAACENLDAKNAPGLADWGKPVGQEVW